MADRSDREQGQPNRCPRRHSLNNRMGPCSRTPSGPAVSTDCINRPDRRLHPTNATASIYLLQRGSHPQKTSSATVWPGLVQAEGIQYSACPWASTLPAPEQTDKGLQSPCRLETGVFYSFVMDHEIPFAYERPLCARQERPLPSVSPNSIARIRSLSAGNADATGDSVRQTTDPFGAGQTGFDIFNHGRARTQPATDTS